jgi:ATP phosphoribosyltransferase
MEIYPPRQLKFAIPSVNSRLHAGSADILGISCLSKETPLALENDRLSLFQLRGTDIPGAVAEGWIDCGLCGLDAVIETKAEVSILRRFPKTTTKIALIGREGAKAPESGNSFFVVTEYPVLTQSYLGTRCRDLRVWKAHGSCESFAFLDGVDGVVDIVDTGETLSRNGLVLQETLFETCICLVAQPTFEHGERDEFLSEIQKLVQELTASARVP